MAGVSKRAAWVAAGAGAWPRRRPIDLDRRWNRKVSTRLSKVFERVGERVWAAVFASFIWLVTFSGAPASSEIEFSAPTFTLVNKFMLAGYA